MNCAQDPSVKIGTLRSRKIGMDSKSALMFAPLAGQAPTYNLGPLGMQELGWKKIKSKV
jgi:hypothetical protein